MSDRELMQQALEALEWCQRRYEGFGPEFIPLAITALRERLAQPVQEPVAWTPQVWRQFRPDGTLEFQKIKRTPNGEWEDSTTPPRREWVGLTKEDWLAIGFKTSEEVRIGLDVAAKLREKNA